MREYEDMAIKVGFVAMHGITGTDFDGAKGQLGNYMQQGVKIIVIDGTDIEDTSQY